MRPRPILLGALLALLSLSATLRADEPPKFVGIGIVLKPGEDGSAWIDRVVPNGPADRGGVKPGDQLLEVDGKTLDDMQIADIVNFMRGPEGSSVTITVQSRGQDPRKLTLQRESLSFPAQPTPAQPAPADNPPAAHDDQQAAAAPVLKFSRVSIHDEQVNNIEAFSILVPDGWKHDGKIAWDPNLAVQANLQLRITDPQSGAQIEFLPLQYYVFMPNAMMPMQPGANYMGSIVSEPIKDLAQYVRTIYAPQVLPQLQQARVVGQEDMPKIAATVQQAYGNQSQANSGRVRFAYTVNGQPWEEDIYLTLVYTPTNAMTMWNVSSAAAVRAPQGQLDRMTPLLTSIIHTARLNQEWFGDLMYVRDLFHQRMMSGIQGAAAVSQQIAANGDEIRRMYADSYKNAQDSEDRISQSFSETTRGVNTYANPFEDRPVELPSGFNDVWVNSSGQFILSNQSGFDPNVGAATEWRRMDQRGQNTP